MAFWRIRFRLATIYLFICSVVSYAQTSSTIRGQVIGRKAGTVYLYSSGSFRNAHQLLDSVRLSSQFFSFTTSLVEPTACFLEMNDAVGQFHFVWDKDVVVTLKPDDLNQSTVDESPLNERLRSFSDTVETVYSRQISEIRTAIALARESGKRDELAQLYQRYTILSIKEWTSITTYIRANNAAWASLFILVAHHRNLGRKTTLDLLNALALNVQSGRLGTQLREAVTNPDYLIIP